MSSQLDLVPLPNLPGYKSNKQKSGSKVKSFDLVNGEIFLVENTLPKIDQSLEDSRSILNIGAGNTAGGKMAAEENVRPALEAFLTTYENKQDFMRYMVRSMVWYFSLLWTSNVFVLGVCGHFLASLLWSN